MLVLTASAALAGIGWYYAGVLRDDALIPDYAPDTFDLVVAGIDDDRIELIPTDEASPDGAWTQPGHYGLEWDGGWSFVGPIIEIEEGRVVRQFEGGAPPPLGVAARLDGFTYPSDPAVAHGIPFDEVAIDGELGPMPAWYIHGEGTTWVIAVHGKGASRREALRMAPAILASGLPSLVITYRNDAEAPRSPDGHYHYGATEWRDLESAVNYAIANGATDVVLAGYSMGAAIVLGFMGNSALEGRVRAVILDSPLLSFGSTVDFQAAGRDLWPPVTAVGKRFATWRFGVDWGATDYRDDARALTVPVLVFHGDADRSTPLADSQAWTTARPDNVRLVVTADAAHVRSWNVDPATYTAEVEEFLFSLR